MAPNVITVPSTKTQEIYVRKYYICKWNHVDSDGFLYEAEAESWHSYETGENLQPMTIKKC